MQAEVEAHVAMYTEDTEEALLEGHPDFVLDAIDNINTKVSTTACAAAVWQAVAHGRVSGRRRNECCRLAYHPGMACVPDCGTMCHIT